MTTDNFCFYLQNRLIQTSQTGGQRYSDTSPFSVLCFLSRLKLVSEIGDYTSGASVGSANSLLVHIRITIRTIKPSMVVINTELQ